MIITEAFMKITNCVKAVFIASRVSERDSVQSLKH